MLMGAYQLKAAVKNQKPPIWRRCIVPAGITYSQLSLILAKVMERSGEEDFEFEFYQAKVRFGENSETKKVRKGFYYSTAEASEFYIDELLDTEDWFSFYYGEDLKLRVAIEKRMKGEIPTWPVITKAVDVAFKDSSLDFKDDLERRIERLNEELKKSYTVRYGEPEYKKAWQIRKDHENGSYGLTGWEKAENDPRKISRSAQFYLGEIADLLNLYVESADPKEAARKAEELKTLISGKTGPMQETSPDIREPDERSKGRISLEERLEWNTKEELRQKADELGLSLSSALKKDTLVQKVGESMLKPEVMRGYFIKLSDEKIRAWEEVVRVGTCHKPSEACLDMMEEIYSDDYLAMYENDFVEVPWEVDREYKKINTPEFQERRKQVSWLFACLKVHTVIYGAAPASVVMRMYRKRPGFRLKQSEFASVFWEIPKADNPCVLMEDKVIRKSLLEGERYEYLMEAQGPGEFSVPEADEILDCFQNGYPSRERHYREIRTFLTEQCRMEEKEAAGWMEDIWLCLARGYEPEEVERRFKETGVIIRESRRRKEFLRFLEKAREYTRIAQYRGMIWRDRFGGGGIF